MLTARAGIRIHRLAIASAIALVGAARAGVMLQGFYKDVPTKNVSTSDPHYSDTYWWDVLAAKSAALGAAGFTAVWLPPVQKGASGGYSVGYDTFDDYDIGSKWQNSPSSGATRYGTRVQLQRLCAMLHANDISVYLDMVENHRDGDPGDKTFRYVNAYGQWPGGRFEKNPGDFHPNVAQDPKVPATWYDADNSYELSWPFGPDLAPINSSTPNRYLFDGLLSAGDWVTKALDADGYRLDYVKGVSTDFLNPFLTSQSMAGKFAVGEYFDGDLGKVRGWISALQGRCSAFDFPLRYKLKEMCMGGGYFNMATLDHAGLAGVDPYHAVTFVENHDTDGNDAISRNKMLAYAYILTSEGYPCVFYKDYATDPGCYGLKPAIDSLIWIHEKIADGATQERWKGADVFAYERLATAGRDNLLVGLNDNETAEQTITVDTGFGPNVTLHDYTGHKPEVTTDGAGRASITIPSNAGGGGYVCYARAGITGGFARTPRETTQEFAGAPDLDIRPAETGGPVRAASIYAQAGRPIRLEFWYHTDASWTADTRIDVSLIDYLGSSAAKSSFGKDGPEGGGFTFTPPITAYYAFNIQAFNTPASDPKPLYWLKAHYTAPQFLQPSLVAALKAAGGLTKAAGEQAAFANGPVDIAQVTKLLRQWNGLE
ncbi:MAG TPA: alpha-amylase family glycosyl hydrolase [Armatimonadota bacterium]|jgi:alpha-amylase